MAERERNTSSITLAGKRGRIENALAKILDRVFMNEDDDVQCTVRYRPGITDIEDPASTMPIVRRWINETLTVAIEFRINGGAKDRAERLPPAGWPIVPGLHTVVDALIEEEDIDIPAPTWDQE